MVMGKQGEQKLTNGEKQRLWKCLGVVGMLLISGILTLMAWGLKEISELNKSQAAATVWMQQTEKDRFRSSDAVEMERRIAEETKELWAAIAAIKTDVALHDAKAPTWYLVESRGLENRLTKGLENGMLRLDARITSFHKVNEKAGG